MISIPDGGPSAQATPQRPLLPYVPARYRGPLMNYFLAPVRADVMDPQAIVDEVMRTMRRHLQRRRSWRSVAELDPFRQALLAVMAHPTEALALAQEAVAYHQLPDEELRRRKAAKAQAGREAYMATQPPTERRLDYLRSLGVTTTPPNRLEASQLIEAALAKRGAAHA
jgi:hypothetical protein